jgi:hypothetical protein
MLPETNITFRPDDFLAFANEEMDMAIMPYVLSHHEDYFLTSVDIPLESGKNKYTIPYRAIGNKLRDVSYKDNSNSIFEMTRITIADESYYQYAGGNSYTGTGFRVFYIENNEIVLLPQDIQNPSGSLKVSFYIRPNQLVEEDRVATITSINTTTGEIGVDSIPDNITLGDMVDLIQVRNPYKCLSYDQTVTNIDAINNIITIDPTMLPDNLAVGDFVASAEECIIPQIPTDLHSMLAQRVACRCLEALGDQAGLQAANLKLAEMEQKGASLLQDRVEDAPMKVNNRHGFLNRLKTRYRR